MRKWNIELVRSFVSDNSECELLSEEYKNTTSPLRFKCKCGNEFETMWKLFVSPSQKKRQCNECGNKSSNAGRIYKISDIKKYISQFDLELLSDDYTNCKTNLDFKCACGNTFEATFDYVKNGNRVKCFECQPKEGNIYIKGTETHNKKDHSDFLQEIHEMHGCEYEVLGVYKGCKNKIKIKHECGYVWATTPDHLFNHQNRCPECYDTKNSHMSKDVQKWLDNADLYYKKEYRFEDCKYKRPLPFDFAVFKNGKLTCLIEVDGQQHYKPFGYIKDKIIREEKFRLTKLRDSIKNEYCKTNNIPLLRIPYFEKDNFEMILSNAMLIPSQASESK